MLDLYGFLYFATHWNWQMARRSTYTYLPITLLWNFSTMDDYDDSVEVPVFKFINQCTPFSDQHYNLSLSALRFEEM